MRIARLIATTAFLLLCARASAETTIVAEGFTNDGRHFLYTVTHVQFSHYDGHVKEHGKEEEEEEIDEPFGTWETVQLAGALDLRNNTQSEYFIDAELQEPTKTGMDDNGEEKTVHAPERLKEKYVSLPSHGAFKKAYSKSGRAVPNRKIGSLTAEVEVVNAEDRKPIEWRDTKTPAWIDGGFEFRNVGPDGENLIAKLSVTRDGKSVDSDEVEIPSTATHGWVQRIEPHFSQDGTRLVWLVRQLPTSTMRGDVGEVASLLAGRTGFPLIEVMAHPGSAAAGPKILAALKKGGFAAVAGSAAKVDRAKTVIYAASGFEDVAKKIAAKVPGGASVEALSWDTRGDVVVAAGKSAL